MNDSDEVAIAIMVVNVVIFTVNILGNSLILLVVRYSKYFSHVTRHLVVHVAVTDILFGCIIVLPMFFNTGLLKWTSYICIIVQSLEMTSSACSGFGICLILVENYLSVRHIDSQGGTHMSLRKARISIVSFWIMLFIIQLVNDFTIKHSDVDISDNSCNVPELSVLVTQISVIILIFITMLFLMIKMMLIIRKSLNNLFQGESSAADLHKQRSVKKKAKLTTLFSIIALGFIISWAPIIAASALYMICPACVSFGTIHIMSSFIQLNSCVNFIVYAIKDKNFKTVCLQILKCKPNEVVPLRSTDN